MAVEPQSATRPPVWPTCILRGHASQIHCLQFVRQNSCLLTGDADGYVVYWDISTMRAMAAWQAHKAPILGLALWGLDKVITHGRDNTARIWKLHPPPADNLPPVPLPSDPLQQLEADKWKPWLLHAVAVNTLNFCAFSMCYQHTSTDLAVPHSSDDTVLIAFPGGDDQTIAVYQFPDEALKAVIPRVQATTTGMVMAVKLVHHRVSQSMILLAGYEGGVTAAFKLLENCTGHGMMIVELIYLSQPHSQPILSLDASPDGDSYFTSSADAMIAMHRISVSPNTSEGQDIADHREDTDNDSLPVPKELPFTLNEQEQSISPSLTAVSQGAHTSDDTHEDGGSSTQFAKQSVDQAKKAGPKPSGLSSVSSSNQHSQTKSAKPPRQVTVQAPYKVVNTKHAGQQSLRVRSDGRLIVTGGWDARIRIYSSTTLKEVAVLKWHKQGVYAVDFSEILTAEDVRAEEYVRMDRGRPEKRETQTKLKHWVAAGAKDGKVSLWEVY